jgi:hypothetical protein
MAVWDEEVLEVATALERLTRGIESAEVPTAEGLRVTRARLDALAAAARAAAQPDLDALEATALGRAVALTRTADGLELAARALGLELADAGVRAPGSLAALLALQQTVAALPALAALRDPRRPADPAPPRPSMPAAIPDKERSPMTSERPAEEPDLGVLDNIATYHREHERYYTWQKMEMAADVSREANRLKVVADVWLAGDGGAPSGATDFSDPRYQAAGCEDLNARSAIAGIGVLFMEGQGEPAEIRTLKAKLRGLSFGLTSTGQWLGEKMDAAWEREAVLLTPELIDAAVPRFQTILTNWRGARDTLLVGKLFALAVDCLDRIDYAPAALRRDRKTAGRFLRTAGWILDQAARLLATSGAELAENDQRWTEYRDVLARVRKAR